MDRLDPMEEFKSGMMLQTATDVFAGSVGPAFGVIGGLKDEPREKQCAAFHAKAVEGLKGLYETLIAIAFGLSTIAYDSGYRRRDIRVNLESNIFKQIYQKLNHC